MQRDEPIQIPLTAEGRAIVDEVVERDGYDDAADYIKSLIRADLERREHQRVEKLIEEGLNSGNAAEVDAQYWKRKRSELDQRLAEQRRDAQRKKSA